LGIFDKFKKKEEPIDYTPKEPIDSRLAEFTNICNDIEDNFIPETVNKEDHLQAQLFQWLSARYDYLDIERETPFGNRNRTDILINGSFAFELKLVDQRTKLRDLLGQLKEYSDSFDYICAVLFFTEQKMLEESSSYIEEYEKLFGVRSIKLSGKKRGQQSKRKPHILKNEPRPTSRTSSKYSRPEPKKKSLADKVIKGFKVAGEVMDTLSPPPEKKPKTTRKKKKTSSKKRKTQSNSNDDPWGLDKVGDFFGSDEPKKRRKKDDDPFGMNSFDDFFGGGKKKKRKSDDDLWGL